MRKPNVFSLITIVALPVAGWSQDEDHLREYVEKAEPCFLTAPATVLGHEAVRVTALEWQGTTWTHDLVVVKPQSDRNPEVIVLYVTGGDPDHKDLLWSRTLADATGLKVAVLFQIPNQPIFELEEDALIAHSFAKFIETGDTTWPLLAPMVKSTVRAMDALQAIDPGSRRFILTGASKRGWTCWLAATVGDDRIAGIAPVVFDNLNFPEQLKTQMEEWGGYSPMIGDYTEKGLQEVVDSEQGQKLLSIVDPFQRIFGVECPVMAINGTHDQYWAPDASKNYWDALEGSRYLVQVPNMGHSLPDGTLGMGSLAAFCRATSEGKQLAKVNSSDGPGGFRVTCTEPPLAVNIWKSKSLNLHFHDQPWWPTSVEPSVDMSFKVEPEAWNQAFLVECVFKDDTGRYSVTSQVQVVRSMSG